MCAVGGWDGRFVDSSKISSIGLLTLNCRIRLYSTKSFKPLGILKYHKQSVQCLEFARALTLTTDAPLESADGDDEDEMTTREKSERSRWLLAGSKDCRASVWLLIDFAK